MTATSGWTAEADATPLTFGDGARGLVSFDRQSATRLELDIVETRFESAGETLAGRLVLPRGGLAVPILVEVHGSERSSALTYNAMQQLGPASGVGVFVYDKRGTGGSTGEYTQDFSVLADDAAAAVHEARRLAGRRAGRVGLHAGSQGGWVAPLAAGLTPVEFVIVGFGLTESPLEENRAETIQDVAEAGFDAEAQRKAGELADAAGVVIASRYRSGYAELGRLKRRYGDEPWFAHVKGEFTGELVRYPPWVLRIFGPSRDVGTSWDHQSEPPLRALEVPLLWMLAGADRSAPPATTRGLLTRLISEGRRITLADFPETDHGIITFRPGAKGERVQTGYASGYFPMILDFALDRPLVAGAYGNAVLTGASIRGRPPK
ncbi:alpha/beta hydrolase family protein [Brevundimonas sp.]|uniref:alpha/beta hydrolase family protein n=1 Tax=Brevundimonas sp. TaxID=1871086 RepID=UPI00356178A1